MPITRNIIIVDTETTGLSPHTGNEVVQIVATAVNYHNLDDHHSGLFEGIIKPQRPEKASARALEVIGPLWDRAKKEGHPPKVIWQEFVNWLKSVDDSKGKNRNYSPIILSHNWKFDSEFIKYHLNEYNIIPYSKEGNTDYPWGMEFDSMQFDFALFSADPNVNNLKLDTVLNRLGMARAADTHDAKEDVILTKNKIVRQLKFFREAAKRMKIAT